MRHRFDGHLEMSPRWGNECFFRDVRVSGAGHCDRGPSIQGDER